jgi:hypothetical protein
VSDGNAARGSNKSVMEVTKAIEQVCPQVPSFSAEKQNSQEECHIDSPLLLRFQFPRWFLCFGLECSVPNKRENNEALIASPVWPNSTIPC